MSLTPINDLPGQTPAAELNEGYLAEAGPAAIAGEAVSGRVRRIPNLGHTLLFIGFAAVLLLFFTLGLGILAGTLPATHGHTAQHPKLELAVQGFAYLGTLAAAWLYFPLVWKQSFLNGVRWNWAATHTHAGRLISGGLALGLGAATASYFISPPKQKLVLDQFLGSASDAWLLTFFGIFVAPVFEEICFRGFLLPAFAIAFDWLRLPRTPEARLRWETTTTVTREAFVFSAALTSALFAMMHFQQDAHLWAVMLLLFGVSLALTWVRVKTDSVAASTMVHAAYNAFNMLAMMIATGGYRHLDRLAH